LLSIIGLNKARTRKVKHAIQWDKREMNANISIEDGDKLEDLDINWKILEQVMCKKDWWMLTGFIRSHE
jgi:hypothetical protein